MVHVHAHSSTRNRAGPVGVPTGNSAVVAQQKQAEQCNPRSIKEFLEGTDNEITSKEEYARLSDLDQRFHVTRFDDDEARRHSHQTVEENMNRYYFCPAFINTMIVMTM